MDVQSFIYKMIDYNGVQLTDDIFLFKASKGRWELWNSADDTSEIISDLKSHSTAVSLINALDTIEFHLEGGRGAGGTEQAHSWIDGGDLGIEEDRSSDNLPARMNNVIKTKTQEHAIAAFRNKHGADAGESLVQIDRQGFVYNYRNGNQSNVSIPKVYKGAMLVHNHPNNSTFSVADMMTTSSTKARGIIATHSKGYRVFEKGQRFDAAGFMKAVHTEGKRGLKGKDINHAVDKFLKRNQKKYGYTFKNVLD